jgi:succinate dehydrogenase/fumarate reductase flavoprotein subunit
MKASTPARIVVKYELIDAASVHVGSGMAGRGDGVVLALDVGVTLTFTTDAVSATGTDFAAFFTGATIVPSLLGVGFVLCTSIGHERAFRQDAAAFWSI